jgi:hypothetical protein
MPMSSWWHSTTGDRPNLSADVERVSGNEVVIAERALELLRGLSYDNAWEVCGTIVSSSNGSPSPFSPRDEHSADRHNNGGHRITNSEQLDVAALSHAAGITDSQVTEFLLSDILTALQQIELDPKTLRTICSLILVELGLPGTLAFEGRSDRFGEILRKLLAADSTSANDLALSYIARLVSAFVGVTRSYPFEVSSLGDWLRRRLREVIGQVPLPEPESHRIFDDEFAGIIGLSEVKVRLLRQIDQLSMARIRAARGLQAPKQSMHAAFLGNPGTGKTEVARKYGKVLKRLGLLAREVFIDTDRSGLVGKYIGQTEAKTTKVIDSALGGVLFIDEAYALNDKNSDHRGYGEEAVAVLVRRMEDDREKLVAIFAGYAKDMNGFLDVNQGLRSRIPLILEFPNYSVEESLRIFSRFASDRECNLRPGVLDAVSDYLERASRASTFGNARTVRNLIEEIERNQASRLAQLSDLVTNDELRTYEVNDVPFFTGNPEGSTADGPARAGYL